MNIILIGPQGCGKGTQANFITQKYHFHHIESGQLIRDICEQSTKKSKLIDDIVNHKGHLIPDGIIIGLIQEFLNTTSFDDLLFDGFPRTVNQYIALKELLKQNHHFIDLAIYLDLTDEEAVKRLSFRRMCPACHKTYSLALEPNLTNCTCGETLIQRVDDKESAIKERLAIFHEQTQPIIDALEADKILKTVNANQSVDAIFSQISTLLS